MYCVFCVQYSEANQQWLEDAAIRMLCVFALDRFADFVSDQVHLHLCTCDTSSEQGNYIVVSGPQTTFRLAYVQRAVMGKFSI